VAAGFRSCWTGDRRRDFYVRIRSISETIPEVLIFDAVKSKYPKLMTVSFRCGLPWSTSFVVVVRLGFINVLYLIHGYSCAHVVYVLVAPCDAVFLYM
jgi:hypothetical protein